jgi:hypothetical protein
MNTFKILTPQPIFYQFLPCPALPCPVVGRARPSFFFFFLFCRRRWTESILAGSKIHYVYLTTTSWQTIARLCETLRLDGLLTKKLPKLTPPWPSIWFSLSFSDRSAPGVSPIHLCKITAPRRNNPSTPVRSLLCQERLVQPAKSVRTNSFEVRLVHSQTSERWKKGSPRLHLHTSIYGSEIKCRGFIRRDEWGVDSFNESVNRNLISYLLNGFYSIILSKTCYVTESSASYIEVHMLMIQMCLFVCLFVYSPRRD